MKFKVFHCSWESFIHTRVIKLIESLRLKLYLNTYDVGRRMLQDINGRISSYAKNDGMIRADHNFSQNPCWELLIAVLPRFQPYPRLLLVTKELKHGHETSGAMNPVEVTRGVVTTPILVLRPASGNRSMKPYVIERLFDSLCLVGTVERAQNAPATHPPPTRGYNTESKGT